MQADALQKQQQLQASEERHAALSKEVQEMREALQSKELAYDRMGQENRQLTEQAVRIPELMVMVSNLEKELSESQVIINSAQPHTHTISHTAKHTPTSEKLTPRLTGNAEILDLLPVPALQC